MSFLIPAIVVSLAIAPIGYASRAERFVRVTPAEMKRIMAASAPPAYPLAARLRRFEGRGEFRLYVIEETGQVTKVEVMTSTGHKELDEAALDALRHWRVRPRSGYAGLIVPVIFHILTPK